MALFKLKLDFFVSSTRVYVDITAEREFAHSQSNFFFFHPQKLSVLFLVELKGGLKIIM